MFLKNYTSEVPVERTVMRIEQVLSKCGVAGINKQFSSNGTVLALSFSIKVSDEANAPAMQVRLPVNVDRALEALWDDYCKNTRHRKKSRNDFVAQATRTAWKIVQDWVEVQMSMIQLKQADFREVFLPYFWIESENQSFYAKISGEGFRQLSAPKE